METHVSWLQCQTSHISWPNSFHFGPSLKSLQPRCWSVAVTVVVDAFCTLWKWRGGALGSSCNELVMYNLCMIEQSGEQHGRPNEFWSFCNNDDLLSHVWKKQTILEPPMPTNKNSNTWHCLSPHSPTRGPGGGRITRAAADGRDSIQSDLCDSRGQACGSHPLDQRRSSCGGCLPLHGGSSTSLQTPCHHYSR